MLRSQMLLSLRYFVSDLQALPSPAPGSVCAALMLCAEDKAAADACAAVCRHLFYYCLMLSILAYLFSSSLLTRECQTSNNAALPRDQLSLTPSMHTR